MQPVTWVVIFSDGSYAYEFDPRTGKETIFTEVLPRKLDAEQLSLRIGQPDKPTGSYVIDLKTGIFLLNAQKVHPAKEIDGRLFPVTNLPVSYAEGMIQFKCSRPIIVGVTRNVMAATYNIGYKVAVPSGTIRQLRHVKGLLHSTVEVTHVQPIISIDAATLEASISVTATATVTNAATGDVVNIKI